MSFGPGEQPIEGRHRLHELDAVRLVGQALVDLEERDDALHAPQVVGGATALDLAVHRVLEQDGAEDAIAPKLGLVMIRLRISCMSVEHLVVIRVGVLRDAVQAESLRRAATALVQGGDETVAGPHLLELLLVHESSGGLLLLASVRRRALWVRLAMEGAGRSMMMAPLASSRLRGARGARLDAYRAKYGNIQRPDRILRAEGDDPDRYEFTKQAAAAILSLLS